MRVMLRSIVRILRRTIRSAVKISRKTLRKARRTIKPVQRQVVKSATAIRDGSLLAARVVSGLLRYRLPGERTTCPVCGGSSLRHLKPLRFARPRTLELEYGFISGCRRCGVLFANPFPSEADLAKSFPADGKAGERERPVSRRRIQRLFEPIAHELDVMRPPRGASVLDFGCGLGGFLDTLSRIGWSTYGIDPGAKVAFQRHKELTAIPDSPTFLLVVLHHVLEHVTEPLQILWRIGRATCTGGFILVSVPNLDDVGAHGDLSYCLRSRTHILTYTRQSLCWLLGTAGFRALDVPLGVGTPLRTIVIGRREEGVLPLPSRPLLSAYAALEKYDARHPDAIAAPRWLPIRLQTTLAAHK